MAKRTTIELSKELADLISQSEAATLRGVSRAAIGYLVANGKLRHREVLGRKFVYRSDVLSFEPGKPGPKVVKAKEGRKGKRKTKPGADREQTKSRRKASKKQT